MKAEASKTLPGGGKTTPTAAASTAVAAAAAAIAGGGEDGVHALLAALMASERYLAGLVNGVARLWAACEAVSWCMYRRAVGRVVLRLCRLPYVLKPTSEAFQ